MAPVATPAIILATLRYGETSKIVRLATRDLGVQGAIAKGASRPKSKFGAALQVLSDGQAQLFIKEGRELQTLGAFDLTKLRIGLAQDLERYASANAMVELMLRAAPPAPLPAAFEALKNGLDALEIAPKMAVEVLTIRLLWQLLGTLGATPALATCAKCGAPLDHSKGLSFSPSDGGALCPLCATGRPIAKLAVEDAEGLRRLVTGTGELPPLEGKHAAAHRRLLARWVQEQVGEGAVFPALDAWQAPRA